MGLGKTIIDNCSQCDCGQKRLIVNKTKFLCQRKNGKGLSSKSTLKPMSSSRKKIEQKYRQAKIDKVALEGEFCTGCGTNNRLSLSHLVPRSRRRDLIDDPRNHTIYCMDGDGQIGCHTLWETKRWDKLIDGTQSLQRVQELDLEYYNLITSKLC